MTERLEIEILPDWDATLTYDVLDRPAAAEEGGGAARPIFVGREPLLEPLVAAICQPQKRGTYLISGYRGSGKTTLLIEALREAQTRLSSGCCLLPLILNVSEVSASLVSGTEAEKDPTLKIDPRHLLVALLRALKQRVASSEKTPAAGKSFPEPIKQAVLDTYTKAGAAEYSRTRTTASETSRSRTWEWTLDLKADLYKVLGVLAGIGVAAVESLAWVGIRAGALHALAAGLVGASAFSFAASRKVSRTLSNKQREQLDIRIDNSLHQLETDLKDILASLHDAGFRTIVVMEELDKIDDREGRQLDAVIRYFKNLFTQAPALFFFVTDRLYFDLISSKIADARRRRSYAVEHTFFTHRVFVGRPMTQDCLQYIERIILDPSVQQKVRTLDERSTLETGTPDSDRFDQFVRVLLFRAANHLFDLKNEIRRYVRSEGDQGSRGNRALLVLDDTSFPDDEAALAVFQDLAEEKARSYALGGGRHYANEVLRDCLISVFNELGSSHPQQVSTFYPVRAGDRAADAKPTPVGPGDQKTRPVPSEDLEEQLDLAETNRICDALISLIEDLHRGGAFEADKTDLTEGFFVWKRSPARAFRFVRKLEKHEEELAAHLRQLAATAAFFGTEGVLRGLGGLPGTAGDVNAEQADGIVKRLSGRVDALGTGKALPVEKALAERSELDAEVALLLEGAYEHHLERLRDRYGLNFTLIGASAYGGRLNLLLMPNGDPRVSPVPRGGTVVLAQGEGDRLELDVRELVSRSTSIERLGLVHVVHDPGARDQISKWRDHWQLAEKRLAGAMAGRPFVCRVGGVLALHEGLDKGQIENLWGQALAESLLFLGYWASHPSRWPSPSPTGTMELRDLGDEAGPSKPTEQVVRTWMVEKKDRLLFIQAFDSMVFSVVSDVMAAFSDVGSVESTPVLVEPINFGKPPPEVKSRFFHFIGTDLTIASGGVVMGSAEDFAAAMVRDGRLIPVLQIPSLPPEDDTSARDRLRKRLESCREDLGNDTRVIIVAPELPEPFADMPATRKTLTSQ